MTAYVRITFIVMGVLGAAFSVFMLGLQERLQRQAIEKVLFVARDGYLFERMYASLPQQVPWNMYTFRVK